MNRRKGNSNSASVRQKRFRLPAIAAVGGACTLAAGVASALELGDIQIHSTLGQPLRASISYALNPNEEIHNYCIFLRSGLSADGLPLLSRARIRVAEGTIVLNGGVPIREPMLSMQLSVSCPYTAKLLRNYTLMFDPAEAAEPQAVAAAVPAAASAAASQAARRRIQAEAPAPARDASPAVAATTPPRAPETRARRTPQVTSGTPQASEPAVPIKSRYLVQPGDTLSEIVSRIEDRPPGLWRAVGHVYAANPHAFINGDVNLIKAGSWLQIPDLYAAAGVAPQPVLRPVAEAPAPTPVAKTPAPTQGTSSFGGVAPAETVAPAESPAFDSGFTNEADLAPAQPALAPAPVADAAVGQPAEPAASQRPAPTSGVAAEPQSAPLADAIPEVSQPAESIRPGDVVVGTDTPVSDTGTTGITASTPAAEAMPGAESSGRSWLLWLGGTGVALILGLLLFGRRVRERFGSLSGGSFATGRVARMRAEEEARQAATEYAERVVDESRRNKKLTLDADFSDGTGLTGSNEIDVSQDFGYDTREIAALTEEQVTAMAEGKSSETDVVPLLKVEESMILEREVPPDHGGKLEDDDSMIVDMSTIQTGEFRQPIGDFSDVEFPVDPDSTGKLRGLTLTEEIDLAILERDYEDELTQTQRVSEDIAKAAVEIAERMESDPYADDTLLVPEAEQLEDTVETVEQPLALDETMDTARTVETIEQPLLDMSQPIDTARTVETIEQPMEMVEPVDTVQTLEQMLGAEASDLTAALPTLSEANLPDLEPGLTGPTAVLPSTLSEEETALLSTEVSPESGAVNDDNVGHLDATGIIDDPTSNMPNFEEELTLEMDLDLNAITGSPKGKKKNVG